MEKNFNYKYEEKAREVLEKSRRKLIYGWIINPLAFLLIMVLVFGLFKIVNDDALLFKLCLGLGTALLVACFTLLIPLRFSDAKIKEAAKEVAEKRKKETVTELKEIQQRKIRSDIYFQRQISELHDEIDFLKNNNSL